MTDFNIDTVTEGSTEDAFEALNAATTPADRFEFLAQDIMGYYMLLVKAVLGFADTAPGDLGRNLGRVGDMAAEIGTNFALRGMVLAGEVTQEEADKLAGVFSDDEDEADAA